jgi:hypothetical protein
MKMRGVALLFAYLLGLGAIVSFGIAGLMALQSSKPTPSAASVAATSQAERLAKPIKQKTVDQKDAQPRQKRKVTHKRKEEAPSYSSGIDAYGYAQEPRRFYNHPFQFFGR